MEIGQICVKIAGRDARRKCVIVEILDDNFVTIDGDVRRRKCNVKHLELLKNKINIKAKADHATVAAEFKKLNIPTWEKKAKEQKEKPKKQRKAKKTAEKPAKTQKKAETKAETKPAEKTKTKTTEEKTVK